LKAVAALAEEPVQQFKGTVSLAERIGAPQNYLGKLLQTLARAGVVQSQKGMGGGFQLARPPQRISLYDVVEPIDHVSRWTGCFMGQAVCSDDVPCALHDRWAGVRDVYLRMLEESTVADVVAASRGKGNARGRIRPRRQPVAPERTSTASAVRRAKRRQERSRQ